MNPPPRYWLPLIWLTVFALWLLVGTSPVIAWTLRLVTLALVVWVIVAAVNIARTKRREMADGGPALTEASVRGLLLGALVIGLVLRVVGWNHGHPGTVAWIGGIMMLVGIAGLIVLQFLIERSRTIDPSFYFNPHWKYGLLLLCIVTLSIQGLAKPTGTIATVNVAFFWVALIALVVQTVGRWIQRRRGVGQSKPTGSAS